MRVPGFEPGAKPWQGFVLPNYTTPASLGWLASEMLTTPASVNGNKCLDI